MASASVKVKYVGFVRNVVGESEEEVALPAGCRVSDLLRLLGERHGSVFLNALFTSSGQSSGQLRPLVRVLVGMKDIRDLAWVDTRVEPGDGVCIVVVVHPAAGG